MGLTNTNDIIEFFDMLFDKIVDLSIECLIAVCVRLQLAHFIGPVVPIEALSVGGESSPCQSCKSPTPLPSVLTHLPAPHHDLVFVWMYLPKPWSLPIP